ncbi:hypothetical protein UlMin_012690 [Ulmus minor]
MPSPKSHRRGQEEKNRRGKLAEKSSSFHGRNPMELTSELRRPKTSPDLLSGKYIVPAVSVNQGRKLTKLLLNVTIQGSVGAVQVVMPPESTVGDLVAAAVSQYAKEGRRPILPAADTSLFSLHYSQFSLEGLDREEKLIELGSRNFFLCQRKSETVRGIVGDATTSSSPSSCAKEAGKVTKSGFNWLKFMDFML